MWPCSIAEDCKEDEASKKMYRKILSCMKRHEWALTHSHKEPE
jgi:hypothetical protein